MASVKDAAADFLARRRVAVTGVSRIPKHHGGNVIYRRLRQRGYEVFAVNPHADRVEGDPCFRDLKSIPGGVEAVVIATRPEAAGATLRECAELGVTRVWMHRAFGTGSVSETAAAWGREHGIRVIEGGCPLMFEPAADPGHKVMRFVSVLAGKGPKVSCRPSAREAAPVHGRVAPGFEEVRSEFERNFAKRGEIGAAVAAYWRGQKVVDLWGGWRTPERDASWNEDTMIVVHSSTKGLAAMTLAVANARGWLDYDAPVASYWPEFAQNGKGAVTVRQLLGHEAGLVLLDEKLTLEKVQDLDSMALMLARQKPAWPPGTRHGYHTMTIGLYMQELVRRVDPLHRSLGRFFRDEIAVPLGLDFYIGLPREIPDERVGRIKLLSPWRGLLALGYTPAAVTLKMLRPRSLLRRSFVGLSVDPNERRYLEVELPAGNGVGTARAIARAYSAFAEGGAELGITPATLERLTAPPQAMRVRDEVLGIPSYFSLGFMRPGPGAAGGASPRAFGASGAGGSSGFADPDARLGYAYVMVKTDFYLVDDPREKALRDALYRSIARLSGPTEGRRLEVNPPPRAPMAPAA